ncbi:unnamed protein product [Scytosiphon promiscuus]
MARGKALILCANGGLRGVRIVEPSGSMACVQCLSIDGRGELLVTGDESGTMCTRLLHSRSRSPRDYQGFQDTGRRSRDHVGGSARLAESGAGDSSALFVSGGKGGVVRLWRARWSGQRREAAGPAADTELHVELVNDMLVGGFQVSCLSASLSFQPPLVLAGTVEGTVFAFHLRHREPSNETNHDSEGSSDEGGVGGGVGGGVPGEAGPRAQVLRSDATAGKMELGVLLMKFEHTRKSIEGVCCSQEQELFAAVDADGIVRTYRPAPGCNNAGSVALVGGRPSSPAGLEETVEVIGLANPRWFQLIVECRLGHRPVSCEFATEAGRERSGPERQGVGRRQEVLRTCTTRGSVRVWPTASLPATPVRPTSQLPSPPPPSERRLDTSDHQAVAPLSQTSSNTVAGGRSDGAGAGSEKTGGAPAVAGGREQENRDPSNPFAKWGSIGAEGRGVGVGSGDDRREGVEDEELVARGEPPVPKPHPAAARRVSFAPADEIYNLQEPYYRSTGRRDRNDQREGKEDDTDEHDQFEAPRPPPPAPTPMPSTGPSRPLGSGQMWGASSARRGSVGINGRGGGSNRGPMDASSGPGTSGMFVAPSKLQEASLWSTAMEQAALERRMRESFDAGAVPEPTAPVYRAAAAAAVNIPPTARTFEGLVSVSLDGPLPRPKRAGKQVSKSHLSKVREQRITEEDLAFEGMEPDCSSIVGFGSAGDRTWPHEELEWYGGRGMFAELERSSVAADRVWDLGRRL